MGRHGQRPTGLDHFSTRVEGWRDWGRTAAPGWLFCHAYWMDMKRDRDGDYWGNMMGPVGAERFVPPRGQWLWVEQRVAVNQPGHADGELAVWPSSGDLFDRRGDRGRSRVLPRWATTCLVPATTGFALFLHTTRHHPRAQPRRERNSRQQFAESLAVPSCREPRGYHPPGVSMPRQLVVLFSALLPTAWLPGQAPEVVANAHGVTTYEGVVRGIGPGFSAAFTAGGIEFVARPNEPAAGPQRLAFTTTDARRGDTVYWSRSVDAAPKVLGNHVRYEHRGDFTEVYEVRRDGVEQSFVFARRPEGNGELVVRVRVTTPLPLARASAEGAFFGSPDRGGVTFGAVTGVDRNGASVRGGLRVHGDELELSLPASFVDSAAYPLVLDPLIGGAFLVGDAAAAIDHRSAIAYDATHNRYCVVWATDFGGADEIRAQLVSGTGVLQGSPMTLHVGGNQDRRPCVVNVNASNRFLAAWSYNSQIGFVLCRAINASNGATSNAVSVAIINSGSSFPHVGLGGDSRAVGDKALIVWNDSTAGSLLMQRVQVPATGDPVLWWGLSTLATGTFGSIAVSKHAGTDGRWGVAWTSNGPGAGPFRDVNAAAVSEIGTACSPITPVFVGGIGANVTECAVACRDGSRFAVAWQDTIAGQVKVRLASLAGLCPTPLSLTSTATPIVGLGAQSAPSIEWANDRWLLAWSQSVPAVGQRVFLKALHPLTGAAGGAEYAVETSTSPQDHPSLVARSSGGGSGDEVLVAWSNGTVRARRAEASGSGTVTSMGGACGIVGLNDFATYSGTPALGTTFTLELLAPTAPVLGLVVGFTANPLVCGPCTLVPSTDVLIGGAGPVPIAVPFQASLIGAELIGQWLQWRQAGCPLATDYGVSNALKFTIAE